MQALRSSAPFVVMGFSSMLLQIIVLRMLLATFSGNELDIGITLSFWLLYAGLGSFAGKNLKFKGAFVAAFVLIALLAIPTVISIKAIRPLLSIVPGETVSLFSTLLTTAIATFPLCFVIGMQFPLAVSYSGTRSGAGKVFGLEAIGAFIAGILFTFVFVSRIDVMTLILLIALLNIMTAFFLSRKKSIILAFAIPLLIYIGFRDSYAGLSWKGLNLIRTTESRYGDIAVIKLRDQSSIYSNGRLMFSYPDRQDEELRAHIPMTLHPSPKQILVIGGSPGILREFLKYPVERVTFTESDPKIIDLSLNLLSQADKKAASDQRVQIVIEDGRKFLKESPGAVYDLIILNLPQPLTAGINRFYTIEFFREAEHALRERGIVAVNLHKSAGYIGRKMQNASGSVYRSLQSVFGHVGVTSQEYGGMFASDTALNSEPDLLENRFFQRDVRTEYFNQYIFREAFSDLNTEYVKTRLGEIKNVNTDLHPSAYLYNLMLWTETHGGKSLHYLTRIKDWHIFIFSFVILGFISFLVFRKKERVLTFSVITSGFSGMSLTLAVILAYQSKYGYIFEMIGLLSATFMTGLWAGALAAKDLARPLKLLFLLESAAVLLAVTATLFFRYEALFYLLILFYGMLVGGQFSAATRSSDKPEAAGSLYAVDLFGSCAGAIIPTLVLIPLLGIHKTLMLVALLKAFSAMMVLTLKK
jgi:spermidine synthase